MSVWTDDINTRRNSYCCNRIIVAELIFGSKVRQKRKM